MDMRAIRGISIRGALLSAAIALSAPVWAPAWAQVPERDVGKEARQAVTLTIYSGDLALVDEIRRVDLAAGRTRLALTGVGAAVRPDSVLLEAPDLRVLERSLAFDLLTPQRLLEASVGQKVRVVRTHPETGEETVLEAELLAIAGGPVLRIGERIETAPPGRIVFDTLPPGLRERPTLLAEVETASAGPRDASLRYLTGGLSWQADYVAHLDESGTRLDLTGFVSLTNDSGTSFEDATLRLVAGVVNQAAPAPRGKGLRMATMEAMAVPAMDMAAPEAAGDRYLYRYDRPVNLAERESKQLTLFQAAEVTVARRYEFVELVNPFPGADEIGPIQASILLELENAKGAGLGRPLPAGTVRVYEAAAGGPLFSGEDRIAHTPEGESLELNLGRAFDVTGTARTTAFERLAKTSFEIAQEITLGNAKDEAVEVKVIGNLPRGWKMLSESLPHQAETAHRVAWSVTVPAKGEAKLTYRLRANQ